MWERVLACGGGKEIGMGSVGEGKERWGGVKKCGGGMEKCMG